MLKKTASGVLAGHCRLTVSPARRGWAGEISSLLGHSEVIVMSAPNETSAHIFDIN
jgi:hypothetical protein